MLNGIGSWYHSQDILLENTHKISNTKAIAILKALKQVLNSSMARIPNGIYIYLNNFRKVYKSNINLENSSHETFKQFRSLVKEWI